MAAKRPTILQIIPELDTGGAELSAVEIAGAIAAAGGRALVLSEGGRIAARVDAAGGEFVPFPAATKNPAHLLWNAWQIARMIGREGVDLVHARSRAPAWSALAAARWTAKPFVTTYHGAYAETVRLKNLYNSVMARGDMVIANSKYTAELIRQRYATPSERIRVIYRGVDGGQFNPSAIDAARRDALRRRWQIGEHERIVLQAARLTKWKGQGVLIEAARLLDASGKLGDAVVVLAGDAQGRDDYADRLHQQIAAAGLKAKVRLVGHVDDIPAALALAHVAVVASIEPEAFGRAATEAEVMGCPVIATGIGAPPETVLAPPRVADSARTGWLVPPGEPAALAAALEEGLGLSDEARAAMGSRARDHVLTSFSLEAMRRQTLEVYDRVLGTSLAAAFEACRPHTPR